MSGIIEKLLDGSGGNHILPFFWQHGEEEAVLRDYMRAICDSGCGAVCVESRPHPDFCGPKWWADMDVILDEARAREMQVWILDDAHFPTGYANGAVENAPPELCRQSICANRIEFSDDMEDISLDGLIPPPFTPNMIERYILSKQPEPRRYEDDSILSVVAFCQASGESVDLTSLVENGVLRWEKPAGDWVLWVCGLSRNCGPHRNYINTLDRQSCRLLIDAVYEPHWRRYKDDFGKTIAGFFSDEPELGNGHLYDQTSRLGDNIDLPFGRELPDELLKRLGENWPSLMYLLWEGYADAALTARVRYAYMDSVTSLVEKNFSFQLGDWCRSRGVMYIGHLIEDNGAHARTGSSLGHFFRGLAGQDMSGIDDIGGQVYPQGEDDNSVNMLGLKRNADFFHFMLGRLASSAAAIEPLKRGRAMCEIFGNYGWAAGVQLEKYLADQFMVRGVNYYVPHAFSPKAFPDPDCPPHFYAHGHNPQFRHFGQLIRYMNRVCALISGGVRVSEAAVLYHAEAEWAGECMPCEKPARLLEESQISFDFIPQDVFARPDVYNTELGSSLVVNARSYKALIIPSAQFLTKAAALGIEKLHSSGFPVLFLESLPEGLCDSEEKVPENLSKCPVLMLDELVKTLRGLMIGEVSAAPSDPYLRVLHITGNSDCYFLISEAAKKYEGAITLPSQGPCYVYDAWQNRLEEAVAEPRGACTVLTVTLEPRKSLAVIFGEPNAKLHAPIPMRGADIPVSGWARSTCESIDYPSFGPSEPVSLPDDLAGEQPEFSGFVRYDASFTAEETGGPYLEITDAAEGVEVFINGRSAGIQIVPPYRYDISGLAAPGENRIAIEVATTLERKCYPLLDPMRKMMTPAPSAGSGITGIVKLYRVGLSG